MNSAELVAIYSEVSIPTMLSIPTINVHVPYDSNSPINSLTPPYCNNHTYKSVPNPPNVFKWCSCHKYLSNCGYNADLCFRDCELRTYVDKFDTRYSKESLAEFIFRKARRKNNNY